MHNNTTNILSTTSNIRMMQAAIQIHLILMDINLDINNPSVHTKTKIISLQKEITAVVIVGQAIILNQV